MTSTTQDCLSPRAQAAKIPWFRFVFCAALVLALVLTPFPANDALAQTASTGALTGTVTDPHGGVVPGAAVRVISDTTGEERTAVAQDNGSYLVPLLLPGPYHVEISKTGFKVAVNQGLRVTVTETVRLDVKLELGTVQESVTIIALASQLETTSSALGKVTSGGVVSEEEK